MIYVLNIVLVLILLGMVAIWATYGLFSAFVQMVLVIVAGTLAFAVWEPLTFWLLGRMPAYAHGVGLLAPFALSLIVLRGVFDKTCRMNVKVPRLADQIGGGVCGLASGVLAFGVLLIGANFTPMAKEAFGWQPYKVVGNAVEADQDGGALWLGIDGWAAAFYTTLSGGSMSPIGGTPLAEAKPDLAKRAVVYRLTRDEYQVRVARPKGVQVVSVHTLPATEEALYALVRDAGVLLPAQREVPGPRRRGARPRRHGPDRCRARRLRLPARGPGHQRQALGPDQRPGRLRRGPRPGREHRQSHRPGAVPPSGRCVVLPPHRAVARWPAAGRRRPARADARRR